MRFNQVKLFMPHSSCFDWPLQGGSSVAVLPTTLTAVCPVPEFEEFYGPINTTKVMSNRSVYQRTLFLGGLVL